MAQLHKPITRAALVYQGGTANVFRVDSFNVRNFGREAARLVQGDYRTCEAFARGLAAAGVRVVSFWCNQAGDISGATWTDDASDQPFTAQQSPVDAVSREGSLDQLWDGVLALRGTLIGF